MTIEYKRKAKPEYKNVVAFVTSEDNKWFD